MSTHTQALNLNKNSKTKLTKLKSTTRFQSTLGIGNKLPNYDLSSTVYLSLIIQLMLNIMNTRSVTLRVRVVG